MQLVLDTDGIALKQQDGNFVVAFEEQNRLISPHKITSIAITSHALISSAAIRLAVEHDIVIYLHHPSTGKVQARMHSVYSANLPDIRRKQVLFAFDTASTAWVIGLFKLKRQHQADNLAFLKNRKPLLAADMDKALADTEGVLLQFSNWEKTLIEDCRNNLLGIEGSLARAYWRMVGEAIGDPSVFDGRNRRPATDTFNAALNYAYGMLYGIVERAILAAGLDPQLGFFHVDDYAKPTLAFDFIEPFRPWLDRMLIEAFLNGQFSASFFELAQGTENGVWLSKDGKRWLIPLLNAWIGEKTPFNGRLLTRQTHIFRFAGEFVQTLRQFEFIPRPQRGDSG